jgi:putative endonuclease
MMTNLSNSVLYTGVTNNLIRRVNEHKHKNVQGFTSKYNYTKLIYYEIYQDIRQAIRREKSIKNFVRRKKEALIDTINSYREDLYDSLL